MRRLESESITNDVIRVENISNALKEVGDVINDGLLIAMVLKGLPPNFKPFTRVITQKKKTLTFSKIMVCLWMDNWTEFTSETFQRLLVDNRIRLKNLSLIRCIKMEPLNVHGEPYFLWQDVSYLSQNYLKTCGFTH